MAKPMKYNGRNYRKAEFEVMQRFSPRVYPCQKCGHPVASGWCCTGCGDNDPTTKAKPTPGTWGTT